MDPITMAALIGAAGTIGGAGISMFGAQQANAQSLANIGPATTASIDAKMAAASKYGISPLAMLGVQPVNAPAQNVFADAASAGQDISRVAMAATSQQEKAAALDMQTKILANAKLENDVVSGQMKNSLNARMLASPGTAPTFPLPRPDPRYTAAVEPGMTRFATDEGIVTRRSRPLAESEFSGDFPGMVQSSYDAVIKSLGLSRDPLNAAVEWGNNFLRPDVLRNSSVYIADPTTGVYAGE